MAARTAICDEGDGLRPCEWHSQGHDCMYSRHFTLKALLWSFSAISQICIGVLPCFQSLTRPDVIPRSLSFASSFHAFSYWKCVSFTWDSRFLYHKCVAHKVFMWTSQFLAFLFSDICCWCGAAFGMNVGGVPWTKQIDPTLLHGFQNVLLLCMVIVMLLLAGFGAGPLYIYFATRHKHLAVKAKWLGSKRSFQYQGSPHYLQLWAHLVLIQLFQG